MHETTQDFFYNRKVTLYQHKKGYRFSVDAPILADFLPARPKAEALEIGTGCGVISLLALYQNKFARVRAMEIQEPLYKLAKKNAGENGFGQRFHAVQGDWNLLSRGYHNIDVIFSNPPYFPVNTGQLSPNPEVRDAKAETRLTLEQLLRHTRGCLSPNGSLYLVLPCTRFSELIKTAPEHGLFPRRIREVFSFRDGKAERFLVQLTTNHVSAEMMAPLIIFQERETDADANRKVYTPEMDRILTGNNRPAMI